MFALTAPLVGAAAAAVLLLYRRVRSKAGRPPLPPGPPADPIIGHLRSMPGAGVKKEEAFQEMSKVYGDVMYFNVLGQSILVLGSEQAANDLLEKRGLNYSNRPRIPFFELFGWGEILPFLSYSERFKKQRKIVQEPFTRQGILDYRSIQIQETLVLLKKLLDEPADFDNHLRRLGIATTMRVAYGHRLLVDDIGYGEMGDRITEVVLGARDPGSTIVDVFPILAKLPSWFPGAWFVRHIEASRPIIQGYINDPFNAVLEKMANGTARPSFTVTNIERLSLEERQSSYEVNEVKMAAHTLFAAGSETMWATLMTFIGAMLVNPDIQEKAQEEIDGVVGNGRLPELDDRPNMPYLDCIIQETMRWHPVVPLGVPHQSAQDDVFRGMFIPAGTTILANARGMSRDETRYADPDRFWPERFLPKPAGNGEEYATSTFGFGRRICPGRYLADVTLWLGMANILCLFDIRKSKDAAGREIQPKISFTSAFTSHPDPFECDILPRSEQKAQLINEAYNAMLASADA